MTDKNGVGVTVVGHDSETRTLVNGYGPPASYVRNVHYIGTGLTNVPQLAGLLNMSANCEQFIKYECHGSALHSSGSPNGWWVSRDLIQMTYWGGASPSDFYKCACGVTNSCADSSRGCNWDKKDDTWREDSGLLTEKSHLPVEIRGYRGIQRKGLPHAGKTEVLRNGLMFGDKLFVIHCNTVILLTVTVKGIVSYIVFVIIAKCSFLWSCKSLKKSWFTVMLKHIVWERK